MDARHLAVPRLVSVAEGDQVPLLGRGSPRHLHAEGVRAVLGPVEGVQGRSPVNEDKLGSGLVPPGWPQVHSERQLTQPPLGLRRDACPGPLVAQMREFFLMGSICLAAAVLVLSSDGRIVITRYTRYPPLLQDGDRLIGPGSVAHQVTEMVGRLDLPPSLYVRQHRFEGRQVRVDVRDEGVLHRCLRDVSLLSIKISLYVSEGRRVKGRLNIVGLVTRAREIRRTATDSVLVHGAHEWSTPWTYETGWCP